MIKQSLIERKAIHANLLYKNLLNNKLSIAFAESISGGSLMAEIVKIKGASKVLKGGIVCYQPESKLHLLDIRPDLLKHISFESQEMSAIMVRNLRQQLSADVHVAITGLADDGASESTKKPVGSIFLSFLYKGKIYKMETTLKGNRSEILAECAIYTFRALNRILFHSAIPQAEKTDEFALQN